MIRFWHTMHSDKKYLKQSLVGNDQVHFFFCFGGSLCSLPYFRP
jgi:hypothetical protein